MTGTRPKPVPTSTLVRAAVRDLLARSPAFAALPSDERRAAAASTVRVAGYLVDPQGLLAQEFRAPLLAGVVAGRGRRSAPVRGDSLLAGSAAFDGLVRAVDFPAFVAGLIENVFNAIVDASIEQMRAYAELLAEVTKTVDRFAADNITDTGARDALVEAFPDTVEAKGASRLCVLANDKARRWRITRAIGLRDPLADLHDPAEQARLVAATRRRLARSRQQLLATMVMMGVNRLR